MAHVLARFKGVNINVLKNVLKEHAPMHAQHGLYLEHVWQNDEDPDEILFMFRADDLQTAKEFIKKTEADALKQDPKVNLPKMTFLK